MFKVSILLSAMICHSLKYMVNYILITEHLGCRRLVQLLPAIIVITIIALKDPSLMGVNSFTDAWNALRCKKEGLLHGEQVIDYKDSQT